jgi:hypothetical protein
LRQARKWRSGSGTAAASRGSSPTSRSGNNLLVQSGRYAAKRQVHGGVEHTIYYHPAHHWNVERMMTAMRASIDYYSRAFGLSVRSSAYRRESGPRRRLGLSKYHHRRRRHFRLDLRDPEALDTVTMLTAHEIAHQWWGNRIRPAGVQVCRSWGSPIFRSDGLEEASRGREYPPTPPIPARPLPDGPAYPGGRRTAPHQRRTQPGLYRVRQGCARFVPAPAANGEDAVNRALRRLVAAYPFTVAPYPRSVDLIAMLREEAKTREDQALITDLFERITLYDLKVDQPKA